MLSEPKKRRNNKREDLLKAGIEEINRNGVTGFSIRRIADACGVSCAAPAKHFGDRNGFLASIIEYVNTQWREQQLRIIEENKDSLRGQIIGLSVGYVKFLVENPHFRSILMLKDDEFDNLYHKMRGELSSLSQQLAYKYCTEINMDPETRIRKQYVIRALIYGAALMFDNGEMEYNDHMLEVVRASIDREFDLA
ncbi:MAG: helix-turn-helix domain-containing protein [Clostridiaceae bacterium]|nr:helix-turn-helix domain-containing protein [Clostridiaceae bacterium]